MCFNKGNSTVGALVNKYALQKSKAGRRDVYCNGDKSQGRMGGLYKIQLNIFEGLEEGRDSKELLFSYTYYHLLVDDDSTNCIPFIERGQNWCVVFISYQPTV